MSRESSNMSNKAEEIEAYRGPNNANEDLEEGRDYKNMEPIKPNRSQTQTSLFIQEQVNLFHQSLRDIHISVLIKSLLLLLYMSVLILGILSVFWASTFQRSHRTKNLNVWVVDYDGGVIGQSLVKMTEDLAQFDTNLGFETVTPEQYGLPPESAFESTNEQVAWGMLVIEPNSSANLTDAIENNTPYDSKGIAKFYTTTGRSSIVVDYIVTAVTRLNSSWITNFSAELRSNLSSDYSEVDIGRMTVQNSNLITLPVQIELIDTAPVRSDVSLSILSVGLIFLIIISFFQIPNFDQIKLMLLGKIPFYQYMIYRPTFNMLTILFLSLSFSLISLAFQQDFSAHFGPQRGFLIYWMINFMGMWALGGASENMVGPVMAYHPPSLGFWLVFWVILNSSTGMYPLELSPGVFHIGRALPVYNVQMAIRTVLFGTKNKLGLNFGILTAWVVINWLMSFPSYLVILKLRKMKAKKAEKAANAKS